MNIVVGLIDVDVSDNVPVVITFRTIVTADGVVGIDAEVIVDVDVGV